MDNKIAKNHTRQFQEQAKEILNSSPRPKQTVSYDDIYHIIEQNELLQIELELQHDELQKAISQFEEERSHYNNLLDFIPFGCFILDKQGTVIDVNDIGADLVGIKKHNLLNKNLLRYVATNFQHVCLEHFHHAISSNDLHSCEIKLLRKDGPMFFAMFDTKATTNSITKQTYLLTFVKDISEHKQRESSLHETQKILTTNERHRSMGEFADIISHELNHPLAVISNYLYGCIRRLETGKFQAKDVIDALKKAGDQSQRINEIILRMKNFTCKGSMIYETVDINNLINETISLIKHEHAAYAINVHYYPLQNSPEIMVDKIHIQQVIVNLARNAIESMRDAGRSDAKIFLEVYHHNQDKIEVNVIDNGPGIPPDHLHQLFNPYFTTKTYGIGLGLAISRKIIEAHGGVLSAEKHPLGTCFKFTLLTKPLSQDLIHQYGGQVS